MKLGILACGLFLVASADRAPLEDREAEASVLRTQPRAQQPTSSSDAQADAARLALERGLQYLAQRQASESDDSLPTAGGSSSAPIGVTALGAIAWMAAGNTCERGPHGEELAKAIEYLLARVDTRPDSKQIGRAHV